MDETETQEPTSDNSGEGDKPEETELSKQEDAAAKRLEKAKAKKENTQRMKDEAEALEKISGRADAGAQAPKPKDIDPEEYSKLVLKGIIPK